MATTNLHKPLISRVSSIGMVVITFWLAAPAWAHPGHGIEPGHSARHWALSPYHWLELACVLVAAGVAARWLAGGGQRRLWNAITIPRRR